MMRIRSLAIAVVAVGGWWQLGDAAAEASCTYMATYPSAVGPHTYMLATATQGRVTATIDTPYVFLRSREVPAQLMRIADVTGFRSDIVRDGLRASGGTAVFIRYGINMGCGNSPAPDGAFDSVGVSGLYVGRPRPRERWVDERPTFDVFRSEHYPLPQRLRGSSGHLVMTKQDSTPTMTSEELFAMYRSLWAESVSIDDSSVSQRIGRWLETNPRAARKQPTSEVANGMLSAVTDARIDATRIPFGGTYAITIVVPSVDSLVMYGQTSTRMRPWSGDMTLDSATGVPITVRTRSYAIDVTTASVLAGFASPGAQINPCSPIPITVGALPIAFEADSTWSGEMWPMGFIECAPPSSALRALTRPGATSFAALGPTSVRFRLHADGRVTFDARAIGNGDTRIVVRGERLSAQSYGPPFD